MLLDDFSKHEVDLALKQMAHSKASSPDGMPPIFFQHYWQNIGGDISQAVLSILNLGKIPTNLNHSYLTLIPKFVSEESF